jgi:hypothetical protein
MIARFKDEDALLERFRNRGTGVCKKRRMSMRELTAVEVESVSGGLATVGRAVATWAIGKALNAASRYIGEGELKEDTFTNPSNVQNVYGA